MKIIVPCLDQTLGFGIHLYPKADHLFWVTYQHVQP